MLDATKPQIEKTPFSGKDYTFDILVAFVPAIIVITIFKMLGVVGVFIPIISIFGGAYLVGLYRKKKRIKVTGRRLLYIVGTIILLLIVIPMAILMLTTDI